MKKILIFSAQEGHASLAAAAAAALQGKGNQVQVVDAVGNNGFFRGYRLFYRFFPQLFRWPYRLSNSSWARRWLNWGSLFYYRRRWQSYLDRWHPDIVLTTYWSYLPVLDRLAPQARWHYFNLVPDPVTPSLLAYSLQAVNFGFGREFQRRGRQLGIPLARLQTIGWLTQPKFFRRYSPRQERQRLGLDPRRLTFLLCGGSEGGQGFLRLLGDLFWHYRENDFQLIVITGSNHSQFKLINHSYHLARKLHHPPRLFLTGFSREMEKLMAASDVVFGKAGPNLIFEAVAQERPFVAVSHIHGQEDGNLKLIRRYRLGWIAENFARQQQLVKQILARPDILLPIKVAQHRLARQNRQASQRLRTIVNHQPITNNKQRALGK